MSLKYTDDEIRDRASSLIGRGARPNAWWAWVTGSDCMAGMAWVLGIRTNRKSTVPHEISIEAFRAKYGWDEVPIERARAGMLIAEFWPELGKAMSDVPNHIEYIHGIDHDAGTITTDSANTGPRPGQDQPRGFYRKTRPITRNFLFAIVIPAKGGEDTSPFGATPPTGLTKKQYKQVAAFLNQWNDRGNIGLTDTRTDKDGIPGVNFWRLVQTWGRDADIYGPRYRIDGITGPRTRQVAAVILKRVTDLKGK